MDRHCRRAWQAGANLSRTAGTSRRISAGLFAEARPPAASSWYVPNTFHPVTTYAHTLHTGGVSPSASLRTYDKLLISLIMTSNMLCKVQDL